MWLNGSVAALNFLILGLAPLQVYYKEGEAKRKRGWREVIL